MTDSLDTSDREAEDPREPIRLPVREMRDEPAPQRAAQEGDLPPRPVVRLGKKEHQQQWFTWREVEAYARLALAAAGGGVPKANSIQRRAANLHVKACMPWSEAEQLALSEAGIDDRVIDELIGECGYMGLESLLTTPDELRQFTRSVLVHQPLASSPQPEAAPAVAQVPEKPDFPLTVWQTMEYAKRALDAMLTHMGMDEDEWNKPTFDQARSAVRSLEYRLAMPDQVELWKARYDSIKRPFSRLHKEAVAKGYDGIVDALAAAPEAPAQADPCPGCTRGGVCKTPDCGRLKLPVDHPLRTGRAPAQAAQSAGEVDSYIDHQQRRGAAWDVIDEAIMAYTLWLADDDYDANGALTKIMTRMQERRAALSHKEPQR